MAQTVSQHFLRYGMPQYPMTRNPHDDETNNVMKSIARTGSMLHTDNNTSRRRSSVCFRPSQYDRRRSSIKLNEQYSKELHDASLKLTTLTKTLRATEDKYTKLLHEYEKITKLYAEAKESAITSVWGYSLEHSREFTCIPHMDSSLAECEHRIGPYKVDSIIGKGQFSIVKVCSKGCSPPDNYLDCIPFVKGDSSRKPFASKTAVKIIPKSEVYTIQAALRIEHEIKTLRKLSPHKNIIDYRDCFHGEKHIYIFTECYPMDLFDFIERFRGVINENIVGLITREVLLAIEHMKAYRIVHRDIKPENILIAIDNSSISVKLCDFGLSLCLPEDNSRLSEFCGSPGFFAPEVLLSDMYCAYKAEIFSLGCVILELLVSDSFFKDQWLFAYSFLKSAKAPEFSRAIRQALTTAQVEIQKKYSQHLSDCYVSMTNILPSTRPFSKELLQNPWIAKANSLHAADVLNGKEPRKLISLHIPEINSISPQNLKRITDARVTPTKNIDVYNKEFLKSNKHHLSPVSTARSSDYTTTPSSSMPSTGRASDSVPSTGRTTDEASDDDDEYNIPLKPSQLFKQKLAVL